MRFDFFIALLLTASLLNACHYRNQKNEENLNQGNGAAGGSTTVPGFATIQSQILAPRCYECHSSSGGNRGGINLESYQTVKNMARAVLASVNNNSMPLNRSPLTTAQKQLLASWVSAGSPENPLQTSPGSPAPAPDDIPGDGVEPNLDWLTVRTLVIEASCLGCHSSPNNRGGVNLETYRNAYDEIEDIEEAIREGSMPPRGPLSDQQKKLILEWIKAGAPEF